MRGRQMWDIGEKKISDLTKLIMKSELALPQFQRLSVWGKSQWIPFLVTILLGRPTGTLLLMEVDDKDKDAFAPRKLETAPDLDKAALKYLLLDGQQRMTTLFQAAHTEFGKGKQLKRAVIDVKSALDDGKLTEEHLSLELRSRIPNATELAHQGKICFSSLVDKAGLAQWRRAFSNEFFGGDDGEFTKVITEVIPGLENVTDYQFPVLLIKSDTPLDVVADIFEGMNRRGQQLNKFDLMVARLYKPLPKGGNYDLREAWLADLEGSASLRQLGVSEKDGMLPLQLIAKQASRLEKDRRGNVKGLNGSDVLELPPPQVIGGRDAELQKLNLSKAVAALNDAAAFLIEHCGVVAPSLLPQQAMLLPLADQFLMPSDERLSDADLKRWFFSVGLAIDYYGSVNSYANRDCDRLRKWSDDPDQVPESVRALTDTFIKDLGLRQIFSREGSILGKTVMALLVSSGARDWATGQFRLNSYDSIDFHHMVPEQRLKTWFPKDPDARRPIAGLTPVWSLTNKKMGSRNAKDILEELGKEATPIMKSHRLDIDLLREAWATKANYRKFCDDRAEQLKTMVIESLGL